MTTTRREQFVHGIIAWLLGTLIVLTALDSVELELFFVLGLIGFLIVTELTAPFNVSPRWRRRLIPLIILGLGIFGVIVIRRILEILPPGLI